MKTMLLQTQIKLQQAKWRAQDKGATAIEYGLLIGLIAVVIIAAVTLIGTRLNTNFNNVATSIPTANP